MSATSPQEVLIDDCSIDQSETGCDHNIIAINGGQRERTVWPRTTGPDITAAPADVPPITAPA